MKKYSKSFSAPDQKSRLEIFRFFGSAFIFFSLSASADDSAFKLPPVPIPADNPQTPAKVFLGKQLFFDPRLSITGTVSCASCHNPLLGGADGRTTSVGVRGQRGGRNAPSAFYAAHLSKQFWDGRAATLEEQALGPITNPIEMGMPSHDEVVKLLGQIPGYVDSFKKAFPEDPNPITKENLGRAIASYERELTPTNSPFDKHLEGKADALNSAAKRGFELFQSIGCVTCHKGPAFAGNLKMGAGPGVFRTFPTEMNSPYVAKYELAKDTGINGQHKWRVPTLRNVALTAPYFHNGLVTDLKEAIRVMASTQLGVDDIAKGDVDDIAEFLNSLTGETPVAAKALPELPPTPGTILVPEFNGPKAAEQ